MIDHVLILAGGSGTRLWPASNSKRPKQFIPVVEGKSLLLLTIERALGLGIPGHVIIITLREQLEPVLAECARIGTGRDRIKVIPEPAPRNTAPAIAIAAEYLRYSSGGENDETAAVLTADHLIYPLDNFAADMRKADALARQGNLVTFGISPTRPETGYGYIKSGEPNEYGSSVASFHEKPDENTARAFLDTGGYYWNSGMFAFQAGTYLDELSLHSPGIGKLFQGIGAKASSHFSGEVEVVMEGPEVERIYKESPGDSIDYAVLEKSSCSAMVHATFEWNDVGSWEEMAALCSERPEAVDPHLNVNGGSEDIVAVESQGNFVYSDLPVALCGLEDLMVVVKNGVVLIAKKGSGQLVKKVVQELQKRGRADIL